MNANDGRIPPHKSPLVSVVGLILLGQLGILVFCVTAVWVIQRVV